MALHLQIFQLENSAAGLLHGAAQADRDKFFIKAVDVDGGADGDNFKGKLAGQAGEAEGVWRFFAHLAGEQGQALFVGYVHAHTLEQLAGEGALWLPAGFLGLFLFVLVLVVLFPGEE